MRKSNLIIVLLLPFLASCQQALVGESTPATLVNESYIQELNQNALAKERDEINFTPGQSANNCVSYLKAIKSSAIVESVNDQIIHAEYLACEVYDLVKDKKLIKQGFTASYGELLSTSLDLTSFRSSLNRRARTEGPSLKDIGEQFLTTDASSVTYETEEWFYRLELVAISDLNQDGIQDWIVLLEDKSKVGNYYAGATLVVLGPTDVSRLKAVSYRSFIK